MEIFLSYASEDKATAETITLSLRDPRSRSFLSIATTYQPVKALTCRSNALSTNPMFLISPDSVAEGRRCVRYTSVSASSGFVEPSRQTDTTPRCQRQLAGDPQRSGDPE